MRGTGEATGLYTGEYLAQEQADAKEILGKKFEMNFSLRFDRSFMLFFHQHGLALSRGQTGPWACTESLGVASTDYRWLTRNRRS